MPDTIRNTLFTMTQGETGKVLWFKLEPTNNEGVPEALNLDGATVTARVSRGTTAVSNLNWVACTPVPDQTANTGECTFTFSEAQAAASNLSATDYRLRVHVVKDGRDYYFPTKPNQTYATLRVLAQ